MRVARYLGGGNVAVVEEPVPACPPGGLLVRTEACGLCSGELMDWYMDRKVPLVIGHEVAGRVMESQDPRFPIGMRVFPHHHAPCMACPMCDRAMHVHCEQWRRTRLDPGGMAERLAVGAENLSDTLAADDLRAVDAALIEPLACVAKSLRLGGYADDGRELAVVGLGSMGLMHLFAAGAGVGYESNPARRDWALAQGLEARPPSTAVPADVIVVCPGSQEALSFGLSLARPGATVMLFAPLPPNEEARLPLSDLYFSDIRIVASYSCGPDDTRAALRLLQAGRLRAEQVVSDFVGITDLPRAYAQMKAGEILKAMVVFD